jgi:hypothetical protein
MVNLRMGIAIPADITMNAAAEGKPSWLSSVETGGQQTRGETVFAKMYLRYAPAYEMHRVFWVCYILFWARVAFRRAVCVYHTKPDSLLPFRTIFSLREMMQIVGAIW